MWSTSCASLSRTLGGLGRKTQNVRSVLLARCQVYQGPLALLAFATRLCRLAISGWLSQAVKSTNANSRKVASHTLDTSQKLTCFLKTAIHTLLEMRTHQRLPGCHQTVQEVLGHLSEYQLCTQFHPTRHHSRQCTSQHLPHRILHSHCFVDPRHFRKLHFQYETRPRRAQTRQNCQLLLPLLQISWPFASLAASAASLHCVPKASTRCANFQLFPMLSPSALDVPLVANTDANSLEVKPDVSASKIPHMFSCRRSLLISEFETFRAWPTFEYCSLN